MMAGSVALLMAALLMAISSILCSGLIDGILLLSFAAIRHVNASAVNLSLTIFREAVKATVGIFIIAYLLAQVQRVRRPRAKEPRWRGPGKVLLFPCRASHSRLFPKKHSFSYSYLTVGIPVGFEGSVGGMVSVGGRGKSGLSSWFSFASWAPRAWFSIYPGDYLGRGNSGLGLREKLDEYLRTQVCAPSQRAKVSEPSSLLTSDKGANPADYPYAYLVTAPRFFGYQFNPVSFWYLYGADKCLAAMILEVNNTFGERRMYFLTPDDADMQADGPTNHRADEADRIKGSGRSGSPRALLKQSWQKDFHVSPFNSRKGSYKLTASDPLAPFMQSHGRLSNTISLISSKGHCKLAARLSEEGAAIDPCDMTWHEKFMFLASWWWVGLLTFPRILKEAFSLFFRHKLHVWYRPEPLKHSIGRKADSTERQLEPIFRRYLEHLVEQSTASLAVKYTASGISRDETRLMLSPAARREAGAAEEVEFKVLTPAFYTRFVYYAQDPEAFFRELDESRTIWVSRPDLLSRLALRKPPSPAPEASMFGDYAYLGIVAKLRVRPERIVRPLTSSAKVAREDRATDDIRDIRISSMDSYVLAHEPAHVRAVYRTCVLKLFVADRIAFGAVPLLEAQLLFLRASLAWLLSAAVGELAAGLSADGRMPSREA